MIPAIKKTGYSRFLRNVGLLLDEGRKKAAYAVNSILVRTYWSVGKEIHDYEKNAGVSLDYGSKFFEAVARDLKERFGRGFSRSNVIYMRLIYKKYPNGQTLSDQLGWSHYTILLGIDGDLERQFYEKQCIAEKWSFRELKRQVNAALFQRIALSKDKNGVLALSKKGCVAGGPEGIIKDPYVLEFLKLREKHTEEELEQKIIDNLQLFLLELGRGFAFVGRQYRISIGDRHFYVDLVFYHRILRCFVLIDLKTGEATHADVGQMNLYLNYFARDENGKGDNPPIGLILSAHKHFDVEYALGGISNKLFVSKYKLYLPSEEELRLEMEKERARAEQERTLAER